MLFVVLIHDWFTCFNLCDFVYLERGFIFVTEKKIHQIK